MASGHWLPRLKLSPQIRARVPFVQLKNTHVKSESTRKTKRPSHSHAALSKREEPRERNESVCQNPHDSITIVNVLIKGGPGNMDGLTCNGDEFSLDCQGLVARSRQNSERAEYSKALATLRNSVGRFSEADRLRILLEIASILGAQGYKRDALETLTEDVGTLNNDLTAEETCLSTQMKMETCLLRPLVTTSFKMAIEEAEVLRSQTSNFAATKDLDSAMVNVLFEYLITCKLHLTYPGSRSRQR